MVATWSCGGSRALDISVSLKLYFLTNAWNSLLKADADTIGSCPFRINLSTRSRAIPMAAEQNSSRTATGKRARRLARMLSTGSSSACNLKREMTRQHRSSPSSKKCRINGVLPELRFDLLRVLIFASMSCTAVSELASFSAATIVPTVTGVTYRIKSVSEGSIFPVRHKSAQLAKVFQRASDLSDKGFRPNELLHCSRIKRPLRW